MANFNTHMNVSAGICGGAAILALSSGLAGNWDIVLFFGIGTLGGLLPDIDSDNSIVIQFVFSVISVLLGFGSIFLMGASFSITELALIGACIFFFSYFGGAWLFKTHTTHRGIFHSVPAGGVAGLLTVALLYGLTNASVSKAWIAGLFMLIGYWTHLILDEFYSVDLTNKRIKRSFGSAFKFYDEKNPVGTVAVYILLVLLPFTLPSPQDFINKVMRPEIVRSLKTKFWPHYLWQAPPPERELR